MLILIHVKDVLKVGFYLMINNLVLEIHVLII